MQKTSSAELASDQIEIDAWLYQEGITENDSRERQAVYSILKKGKRPYLQLEGDLCIKNFRHLTALPKKLTVDGDFFLSDCTGLTTLPEQLTIGKSFILINCTSFTAIHGQITVGGNLDLRQCTALTEIHGQITVDGNFYLYGCTALTEIHGQITVDGDFYLYGCTALTAIHGQITVGGSLYLSDCTALTEIHGQITVDGNLELYDCAALTAIHGQIKVGGSIDLSLCTALTEIHGQITVGGNFFLSECTGLTAIHEQIMVGGNLNLYGCTALTAIHGQIKVDGNLDLSGCTALTAIHGQITVDGNLDLSGCTALTALPEQLTVDGNLNLSECTGLTAIHEQITVDGNFRLSECTGLTAIHEQIMVGGYLDLSGCTALTAIHGQITVGGYLGLSGCTALTALPEQLTVDGNLDLSGCTALTALPEQLKVDGNLDLSGCTALTALPEQLTVDGNLLLNGCTGLTTLPEQLTVGGHLDLSFCWNITNLPQSIATWGRCRNGEIRMIDISETGISAQTREQIRAQDIEGIQYFFNMVAEETRLRQDETPRTLNAMVARWEAVPGFNTLPNEVLSQNFELIEYSEHQLAEFLSRLFHTAEYQNFYARPNLAERVSSLLLNMRLDRALQEMCSALIEEALTSCGDRVALYLNKIELAIKIHNVQKDNSFPHALEHLGLALIKLEVVHKHAETTCNRLSMVDAIEVHLAYEVRLREQLNLPVSTSAMLYERIADVTDDELEAAAVAANRAVQPGARQRLTFFETWEPWQKRLRQQAAAHYSYAQLHQNRIDPDNNRICPFTQEPIGNLLEPVLIGSPKAARVYEGEDFIHWWKEHGKEPAPGPQNEVSLDDLWRPKKEQ